MSFCVAPTITAFLPNNHSNMTGTGLDKHKFLCLVGLHLGAAGAVMVTGCTEQMFA
jgi:hypothetical protein